MPFQEVFELPSLNLDTNLWNKLDTVVKVLKKLICGNGFGFF
jgi:hypothetical protein